MEPSTLVYKVIQLETFALNQKMFKLIALILRASLCKILISSFVHKMDLANNFSVDFF